MPHEPQQRRGRNSPDKLRRRIAYLHGQGLTLQEIAERAGVSRESVVCVLNEGNKLLPLPGIRCSVCAAELTPRRGMFRPHGPVLCLACLRKKPRTTFAERLRAFRLAAGLSQKELAAQVKVGVHDLTDYERGRSSPRWSPLERLICFFGPQLVDMDNVFAGRPPSQPSPLHRVFGTPVESCGFSVRTTNLLLNMQVRTLEELLRVLAQEPARLRGMQIGALRELTTWLETRGLEPPRV